MTDLPAILINPLTQQAIAAYQAQPTGAVLLIGNTGAGKLYVAQTMARQFLGHDASQSGLLIVEPNDKQAISIDDIRRVKAFTRLRAPGNQAIKRVIIVADAHTMSGEAQNALLKILEEPPEDTVLILTAPTAKHVLPTIASRVMAITVQPVSFDLAADFFGREDAELRKAYYLSHGSAGLLTALVNNTDHQLLSAVEQAKQLLSVSAFERLAQVDALAKQKAGLPLLLDGLERVAHAALTQAAAKNNAAGINTWRKKLERILFAESALSSNPNTKLLLTDLLLNL